MGYITSKRSKFVIGWRAEHTRRSLSAVASETAYIAKRKILIYDNLCALILYQMLHKEFNIGFLAIIKKINEEEKHKLSLAP